MGKPPKDSIISYFRSIFHREPASKKSGDEMTILKFLDLVKRGHWSEQIKGVYAEQDPAARKKLKEKLPAVTISGKFSASRNSALIQHSGFICMDFDHVQDLAATLENLRSDPYTYAVFKSASGKGIACIVKVDQDPEKHKGSFRRLSDYYAEIHGLAADMQCSDLKRFRYVSSDPELYHNPESKKWTKSAVKVLEREEAKRNLNIVSTPSDMEEILEQIESRHIDMTVNYNDWIAIGFALVDGLGESGRDVFHRVSAISPQYDPEQCNKKYTNFINTYQDSGYKIGTFYHFCISNGVEVNSDKTRKAVSLATIKKNQDGTTYETARSYICKQLDMPLEDAEAVVKKVWESKSIESGLNMPSKIHLFIQHNYVRKYNQLTDQLHINNKALTVSIRNDVIMAVRQMYGQKASVLDINSALDNHEHIEHFHPVRDFLNTSDKNQDGGHIKKLLSSVPCRTAIGGLTPADYLYRFGRKWLIACAAAVDGHPNQLVLALVGAQNTGKTHFFNHILPKHLKEYFDTSTLDYADKRAIDIKLTQMMLICDDEGGSKNYHESKRFKMLTSLGDVTTRKIYTDQSITKKRMASFCMTSNEMHILTDDTGNRRIIPVDIGEHYIDRDIYNSVNKDGLWFEAWQAYKAGESYQLTREEVDMFMSSFNEFKVIDELEEVINAILEKDRTRMSVVSFADIQKYMAMYYPATRNIYPGKLGAKLNKMGFEKQSKVMRVEGNLVKETKYYARIKPLPPANQLADGTTSRF